MSMPDGTLVLTLLFIPLGSEYIFSKYKNIFCCLHKYIYVIIQDGESGAGFDWVIAGLRDCKITRLKDYKIERLYEELI